MHRIRANSTRSLWRVITTSAWMFHFYLALSGLSAAHADYVVSIGDKIQIQVFGQQDLNHAATVDADGLLWIPTMGHITAKGRTLKEIRQVIAKALSSHEIIRPQDVSASILEFRPFYIDGTIEKPGAYPFRVGLKVRQAVALAGGIQRVPPELNSNFMYQGDPQTSYQSLRSRYLRLKARVARLQSERTQQSTFNWNPPAELQVTRSQRDIISATEAAQLAARRKSFEQETENLKHLIQLSEKEIELLENQYRRLEEEDERVTGILEKLQDLKEKGVVSQSRVSTFERDVFSSRYARDSTRSQLAEARRRKEEFIGKRAKLKLDRDVEITREINATSVEIDVLQSQLLISAMRPQMTNLSPERICAPRPSEGIYIYRPLEDGRMERLKATEESDVRPGDVISVDITGSALKLFCGHEDGIQATSWVSRH